MNDRNNIERHLAFRNYMRTHEKERMEYAKLKIELVPVRKVEEALRRLFG